MERKKEISLTKELARRLQRKFPSYHIFANKCPSRGKRIKRRWYEVFNEPCPPLQPEIDIVILEPSDSLGRQNIRAIEVKFYRKTDDRINQSFYKGIEQSLALLQWGFDNVALWQVFDESFSNDELRDYGCRTWLYVHGVLHLPIEFTPLQLVQRARSIGFQVIQADWWDELTPLRLRDIDDPDFCFRYTHQNPFVNEQLRRHMFRNFTDAPIIRRMFREIDTLRHFLLEWLPTVKSGLNT